MRAQPADTQQRLADAYWALSEERTIRIRAEVRSTELEEQRRRYEQEARDERERAVEARVAEAVMKRQLAEMEKKMKVGLSRGTEKPVYGGAVALRRFGRA